jgi:hypothetical protein
MLYVVPLLLKSMCYCSRHKGSFIIWRSQGKLSLIPNLRPKADEGWNFSSTIVYATGDVFRIDRRSTHPDHISMPPGAAITLLRQGYKASNINPVGLVANRELHTVMFLAMIIRLTFSNYRRNRVSLKGLVEKSSSNALWLKVAQEWLPFLEQKQEHSNIHISSNHTSYKLGTIVSKEPSYEHFRFTIVMS